MTRRKKKLEPMSIRLDPDVKAALQGFAEEEERSLSFYVNRVLRKHVEQVEAGKQTADPQDAKKPDGKKRPLDRS
jgi:hypothetical protein